MSDTMLTRLVAAIEDAIVQQCRADDMPGNWCGNAWEDEGMRRLGMDGEFVLAPIVRAVLRELREPSEGMIDAGMKHAGTDLASEFTAMIDSILNEEQ